MGLTTSATMAQIQAKMADKSTFVVDAAEFNNFELPDKPWLVTFYKLNSWRCYAIGLDAYSGVISSATVLKYAVYNYSEWLGWFSLVKNSDLPEIQIGSKAIKISASDETQEISIDFPKAFTKNTLIVIPIFHAGEAWAKRGITYHVSSFNKTSFSLIFNSGSATSGTPTIRYLAIAL